MNIHALSAVCLSALTAIASATETPIELFKESSFQPVYMHGVVSAARGWRMHDEARVHSIRKERVYVSGEDCFKLSFADGVFSIVFKSPLNPIYRKGYVTLTSRNGDGAELLPPADHYTFQCRVKFKNGDLGLTGGHPFPKSDEWQDIVLTLKTPISSFLFNPREGAEYHFAEAHLYAEYPQIGGFIALPDGGRLEKILIPENASFETRLGITLWRGWLWRLTGVALPIETAKSVDAPVKGALVALKGPEPPGRWSLKVDRDGVVVSYGTELEIINSIFDYLRRGLGCAFYQRDCVKIPEMGSVKALPGIEFTAAPHYNYFNSCSALCAQQGGVANTLMYTRDDVDYYHLPTAKSDHVFNVLLPQEQYFTTHPEYFADDGNGHRRVRENPHYTMHCLTNPEVMEKVLDSAVEYAKAQYGPQRLVIDEGDAKEHCLCPECVKFNNGRTSCSNVVYEYHRRLAKRIAEVRPDFLVERHSYASRIELPDDVSELPPNTRLFYCMGTFRCKLHVECEANREALELVKRLRKLVGDDPRRMSFMHYHDLRPLYMVKQMSTLQKYGSDCYFLWRYKSFHPSIPFLLGRWNLGEDPEKLLHEFEEAYYGKSAPFVHQVFMLTEKFAEEYKHSPEELKLKKSCAIWPDTFGGTETVLDRATLDRIHELFRKALKAAGKDKNARRHIYRDWLFFLSEDLRKFRPSSCRTAAELKQYTGRLAAVVRMGQEFPGSFDTLMHQTGAREFLSGVTGVTIPRTKKNWAREPILRNIINEPEKYLSLNGENFMGHGIYFKPVFFRSSFESTDETRPEVKFSERPRDNMLLRPQQEMELTITLRKFSGRPLALGIEGAVQTANTAYPISVTVNGNSIYNGNASFAADKWSRMGFTIPPEFLKEGDNLLKIKNLSPAAGWLAISEIYTIDVSADFQEFAAGNDSMWRPLHENGSSADSAAQGGKGKMILTAPEGSSQVQAFFANRHDFPKIAVSPRGKVELTVRASGRGKLRLAVIRYSPYELDAKGEQIVKPVGYTRHVGNMGERRSPGFKLDAEEREYRHVFELPEGAGMVIPEIIVQGGCAEVTDFAVRVLQP